MNRTPHKEPTEETIKIRSRIVGASKNAPAKRPVSPRPTSFSPNVERTQRQAPISQRPAPRTGAPQRPPQHTAPLADASRRPIPRTASPRTQMPRTAPLGPKAAPPRKRPVAKKQPRITVGCVIRRSLLVVGTALLLAVAALFSVVGMLAHGPSETARNKAVMSAMQASATKWVPGLFLSEETVNAIIEESRVVNTDVVSLDQIQSGDDSDDPAGTVDRWANTPDEGILFETYNGKTFKGYVVLIKDPARVTVGISDESFAKAMRIFEIAEKYNAIAALNGGEFPDNGVKTGSNPVGLTYAGGKCVWDDGLRRTFMGFDNENKLFVGEGTTRAEADALGIRDAVAFQTGNVLITNDGENVTYYYADSNTGVAQRTAIGQLADGTVMFLATDGRTASSLGATKNDIIDVFVSYGAVTAGMLDGGSSTTLYYRDWYDKYDTDKSKLDEWQQMGLVNKYKAFTNPRSIPTFFIVK